MTSGRLYQHIYHLRVPQCARFLAGACIWMQSWWTRPVPWTTIMRCAENVSAASEPFAVSLGSTVT